MAERTRSKTGGIDEQYLGLKHVKADTHRDPLFGLHRKPEKVSPLADRGDLNRTLQHSLARTISAL
jgi:hypothetical protein